MTVVSIASAFSDRPRSLRATVLGLALVIGAANLLAWLWALMAFHDYPVLLGTAFLAYSFGLRHAVDADHIAAIDNVTRKLMQEGKRPVARRLLFLARPFDRGGAGRGRRRRDRRRAARPVSRRSRKSAASIGTAVSALFLLAIAVVNLFILRQRSTNSFQPRASAASTLGEDDLDTLLAGSGFLARLFRPLFRMIDTQLAHVSARLAVRPRLRHRDRDRPARHRRRARRRTGCSFWSILVFPALFTAGMR